jgi:hypothetical protein
VRLDLPSGQWAELHDSLTHGERKAVQRAFFAASKDVEESPEMDTALVRAYLAEWNVTGRDGHELAITELDKAPSESVDAIAAAALALWDGRADPNASGGK